MFKTKLLKMLNYGFKNIDNKYTEKITKIWISELNLELENKDILII